MKHHYFLKLDISRKNKLKSKKMFSDLSTLFDNSKMLDNSLKKNYKVQLFFLLCNDLWPQTLKLKLTKKYSRCMSSQNNKIPKKPIYFFENDRYDSIKIVEESKSGSRSLITKDNMKVKSYLRLNLINNLKKIKKKKRSIENKVNRVFFQLFEELTLLQKYKDFFLSQLINNINNIPYSILIIWINRYFRFWKSLRVILTIFTFFCKSSKYNSNLYKGLKLRSYKVKSLCNVSCFNLWKLKSNFFLLKVEGYSYLIIQVLKKRNEIYLKDKYPTSIGYSQKVILNWLYFHKKSLKTKNVMNLNYCFNLLKFIKKYDNFQPNLKLNLWRINRKTHNQRSFKWIFKKYWLKLNFYKHQMNKSNFRGILKNRSLIFYKNNIRIKNSNILNLNYLNISDSSLSKLKLNTNKSISTSTLYTYSINDLV